MDRRQQLLQAARKAISSAPKRAAPAMPLRKELYRDSTDAVDALLKSGRSRAEVTDWLLEQEKVNAERKSAVWWAYYHHVNRRWRRLEREKQQTTTTAQS